jgi:ankyrin repeat protein
VGRPAIVEYLLEQGADPHSKDSRDRTALDMAIKRDHSAVVRILQPVTG